MFLDVIAPLLEDSVHIILFLFVNIKLFLHLYLEHKQKLYKVNDSSDAFPFYAVNQFSQLKSSPLFINW